MDVTEAVIKRKSTRAFLPDPVSDDQLAELLTKASRSPSGGNLQPWRVFVLNGDAMTRFKAFRAEREMEEPAYDVYPPGLTEPYRSSRFAIGEQLYAAIDIPREDRGARLKQMFKNYEFFGAPAALFCFIDRQMGPPQWSDLGMFLQTFMLLATEAGLETCAQEAWAVWEAAVAEFVGAPPELGLFCGLAIGHGDPDHAINGFTSNRAPLEEFATFVS